LFCSYFGFFQTSPCPQLTDELDPIIFRVDASKLIKRLDPRN